MIAIPLIWGCYKGFTKGIIIEIATLLALALGIYGGVKFSGFIATFLSKHFHWNQSYLSLLSFIILFLAIIIGIFMIAKLMERLVKIIALGIVNRIFGALFGTLKYALMISVFLLIANTADKKFHLISPEIKEKSLLYQPVAAIAPIVIPVIKEYL